MRALLLALALAPLQAYAWGASGHRYVSSVAMESLPAGIPAFLRTAWAGELGREPDRSKGSGYSHDRDLDPGHFLNLGDSGLVADLVPIDPLPPDREIYDSALRAQGLTEYKVGFLPYSIVDGWQQVRKDFAYWRADVAGKHWAKSEKERAWFDQDRKLREMLTLRDIGYWSHFVADGSQPLHTSTHYNGWGNHPNPEGYSDSHEVHARFEGAYVRAHVQKKEVTAALPPPKPVACDIENETVAYLIETNHQVVPFYRLEKRGAFELEKTTGKAFVTARLAAGASELRDMVVAAWKCSVEVNVGYPPISVKDVEAGRMDAYPALNGLD